MVCLHYKFNFSEVLNRRHLRPTTENARVEPHNLQAWRVSHRMLGPCCLCPMADHAEPDFKEAAIHQMRNASTGSQCYVASCAWDLCGYFGKRRNIPLGHNSLLIMWQSSFGARLPLPETWR
jgi:hypothetical protein